MSEGQPTVTHVACPLNVLLLQNLKVIFFNTTVSVDTTILYSEVTNY